MRNIILALIAGFIIGFSVGSYLSHRKCVKRALELPNKDAYTNQDIEYILFNEPQI